MQKEVIFKNSRVSFSDIGKGPAVVLLHGFLENSTMWQEVIPVFSETHRVITIDLLGHGKTPPIGYVHAMELMAEAVETVVKHLRIRKLVLIGHSMGGYAALAFAENHPQKIKGLCLMNSTSQKDDDERKKLRAKANKMIQNNFTNMVRISFTNLFSEESKIAFKSEIESALAKALETPIQGYIASQEGMKIRPDRMAFLQEQYFKKLMIIGKKDPVLDYKASLAEAKKIHAETAVFNAGHMSHIENKPELLATLQQFVHTC